MLVRDLSQTRIRGGYVSIGNFDGVHAGHQRMVTTLKRWARAASVPAVVMTFDPHPWEFLRPQGAPPSLTTLEERARLLSHYGADYVVAYPTSQALLALNPDEFFHEVIEAKLGAKGLVEGPNFFFGRNREGNITRLRGLCDQAGMSLEVVPPVMVEDQLVSSSVIRSLLMAGDVNHAVSLLGHLYRVQGRVVSGAGRGGKLGFPTANLELCETIVPGVGVYAGEALVGDQRYAAAIHIGPNPTFGEHCKKLEAHIIDFTGDLYSKQITVAFRERLRDIKKFDGVSDLQEQLKQDIASAANCFVHHDHGF